MPLDRKLSTLELTVLGVVLKRSPCTAYAVMSEFSGSASSAYRSGAGSIYPLLHRLEKAGFVSSQQGSDRGETLYEITQEGIAALRGWFILSMNEEDFSCSLDVLRSRTYFMKVLGTDEREEFFKTALKGLANLLKNCEEQVEGYRKSGDRFSELAMEGTVMETKARIRWLRRFREEVREDQ